MRYLAIILISLLFASCTKDAWDAKITTCASGDSINVNHPKAAALQALMDEYTALGIPGIAIAIRSDEGYWAGASGFAKIEEDILMEPCHLQYSQSVAKTYMAVAILKLYEEGRINLDESIVAYLPENVCNKIADADRITVRMLLNHTSGIDEYNDKAAYVSYLLQHPMHEFSSADYLDYIDGNPLVFEPGSKYQYTNTNYLLLALLADAITGDHSRYIRRQILEPPGLNNTFYHNSEDYLDRPELVNSYWDRYSNGAIENCTEMQKVNVRSLVGDDGIVATPMDYVRFSEALYSGQLLSPATMDEMRQFVRNDASEAYGYGLGIHTDSYNGHTEYGHSGGGIGAGCYLSYLPGKNTHVFIGVNIGTIVYSKIFDDAGDIRERVFDILVE